MSRTRTNRRGFTLTEILVALAIFALGGTAIMALFITNIRLSRDAMDYTRSAEISRNIRSLMTMSVSRPEYISENNRIYQFAYPETSLTFESRRYQEEFESAARRGTAVPESALGGSPAENTVLYKLPEQPFNASQLGSSDSDSEMVTRLPSNALAPNGGPRSWTDGQDPRVFRFKPDMLRRARALDGLDADDRMGYQFDLQIRRSVARSSVPDATGEGANMPLEDLYVVHVRVYKNFEFRADVQNDPIFEWDFFVTATR